MLEMIDLQVWTGITIAMTAIALVHILVYTSTIASTQSIAMEQARSIIKSDELVNNYITGLAYFSDDIKSVEPQTVSSKKLKEKFGNCKICGNGTMTRVVIDENKKIVFIRV